MSTFRMMKNKCGLSGHVFESRTLTSTNAFGSPDLDLRPPQMKRATMPMWIDKCPNCGYVHAEIEKNGKQHKAFIKSKDYIMCEGAKLSSGLARDFYKFALILLREDKRLEAYDAFLHAAWASDDSGDVEGAVLCRNKAISLYDDKSFKKNLNLALRHIDLLRRAGRFTDVINFCKAMVFEEDIMQKVAKFQVELSSIKDAGCYRVVDCEAVFMKLYDEPFELIKSGKKKIEVRCNDEKRKTLKVGDKIIFCRYSNPSEKIYAEVTDLQSFDTFKELYTSYPMNQFGHEDKSVEEMLVAVDKIYSKENQKKYGALAITISVHPRSIFG